MKLHERLDMIAQSRAVKYTTSTQWWKLIEEFLKDRKLELIKRICLKAGMKGNTMTRLTEEEVDQYRKEVVDIDWFLKLPEWYIKDEVNESPDKELEEDHFKDVLNTNVL